MVDTTQFCRMAGVERAVLEAWIEAGWLSPEQERQDRQFSSIDLVRAKLILDLSGPMGVNEEGIAVILHLLDQINGLRRALRGAAAASSSSPASSRRAGHDGIDPLHRT